MLRILLILLFPISIFAQKTALESQTMRFEAMVKRDSASLEKMLDQELTYLHSNGLLENKADFIHSISSKKLVYEQIQIEKSQIRRYKRIAIIQGTGLFKGIIKGNPFNIKLKYISVYKRKKHKWKLIAWQSLKVDA